MLSDELLALLKMVNAEHQAIVKAEIDVEAIVERWVRAPSKYSLDYQIAGSMINGLLTSIPPAAETMVDLLHHVGNVLFVGDMTCGCYLGLGIGMPSKLPFSQIPITFGNALRIFPEGDYFEETRGFLPDLWVPAAQAEEMAIKLLLNSK